MRGSRVRQAAGRCRASEPARAAASPRFVSPSAGRADGGEQAGGCGRLEVVARGRRAGVDEIAVVTGGHTAAEEAVVQGVCQPRRHPPILKQVLQRRPEQPSVRWRSANSEICECCAERWASTNGVTSASVEALDRGSRTHRSTGAGSSPPFLEACEGRMLEPPDTSSARAPAPARTVPVRRTDGWRRRRRVSMPRRWLGANLSPPRPCTPVDESPAPARDPVAQRRFTGPSAYHVPPDAASDPRQLRSSRQNPILHGDDEFAAPLQTAVVRASLHEVIASR